MTGHSRLPPEKRGHPGPERTILHRDEEKPENYASTLRSAFKDPESHSNFFPPDGGKVLKYTFQTLILNNYLTLMF